MIYKMNNDQLKKVDLDSGLGGFIKDRIYWSSSETDDQRAKIITVGSNTIYSKPKSDKYYVSAFRAF